MSLHIYTDGSSLGNPGRGGASAVFVTNDTHIFSRVYSESQTTNNRMELMGMILAVETVNEMECTQTTIYTDSNYVLKGITVWSRNWIRRGWKRADGKPVLNTDLWKELLSHTQATDRIEYKKIKAHSGDRFNDLADRLAKDSAKKTLCSSNE